MLYVVLFLVGVGMGASPLIIWYYSYVALLIKERQSLQAGEERLRSQMAALSQEAKELADRKQACDTAIADFDARKIKYDSLVRENGGLKQDCFNLSVQVKKMERDHAAVAQRQDEVSARANDLAARYLKDSVSWINERLNPNNFSSCKQRLLSIVRACRSIGFDVPEKQETELIEDLQRGFEQAVRDEFARQEQARITAQIREEESLSRKIDKQIKDAEREKAAIEAALEKALRETKDEHSAEVQLLKAKLKEAEEKAQRNFAGAVDEGRPCLRSFQYRLVRRRGVQSWYDEEA